MADIISFADHRKPAPEKPTVEQLAALCSEEIAGNWERFARNNRLNDYFMQSTPTWSVAGINYLSDLNALSVLESKINLFAGIMAPGLIDPSQLGWCAGFRINGVDIKTPDMLSEAYARCFNILLFLKLGREMTQHGITIT